LTRPPQISPGRLVYGQGLRQPRRLVNVFWLVTLFACVYFALTIHDVAFESLLAALLIIVSALFPVYLWCSGRAPGLPIFPIFALSYLWTYAIPLLSSHPYVVEYSPERHLTAGLTVASFLFFGTFIWFRVVARPLRQMPPLRCLEAGESDTIFLFALAMNVFFTMGLIAGWFQIDGALISLIRGVVFGLSALAIFILSYQWGKQSLSRKKFYVFVILMVLSMLASASSLLIIGAISMLLPAVMGFVMGRQKVPWLTLCIALGCLIILHSGKTLMREKYVYGEQQRAVQPWEYIGWFSEWVGYSLTSIMQDDSQRQNAPNSFVDRAGLIHLLLLVQSKSPDEIPYLYGETYKIIPRLLIPRVFDPDKPTSHEGTILLNIHYGKQSREETAQTTIGWGLLNEAYANFGLAGVLLLSVILGIAYGAVTRWSLNTPVLSARFLFAVLLMNFSFQTEFAASVYATALFQYSIPLFLLSVFFMRAKQISPTIRTHSEKKRAQESSNEKAGNHINASHPI